VLSRLLSPARDFISKPFSPAALIEKVRQVTRKPEPGSEFHGVAALIEL
jgi:DNA-binding response OmpR family regulator